MNNYNNYGNRRYPSGTCGCANQPARNSNDCGCNTVPARNTNDCGCTSEVKGATDCGCVIGTAEEKDKCCEKDLPGKALGMAYVPWQEWKEIYDVCEGFSNGTIFKQLDLDFLGRRCN